MFSTRTRYGLRFLLRLAEGQKENKLVSVEKIAEIESISQAYLEQIIRALRPLGILKAVRGVGGGFSLCKKPEEINLEDVFSHLEGNISIVRCLTEYCPREDCCTTKKFWKDFDEHTRTYLRAKTLKDLEICETENDNRGSSSKNRSE